MGVLRTKSSNMFIAILFLGLLFSTNVYVQAQNNTATDDKLVDSSPEEDAVQPIYDMTNFFLGNMLKKQVNLANALDLNGLINGTSGVSSLSTAWQTLAQQYISYLLCILVGILFIIVMPIVGLIVLCCRVCCKKCGGDVDPMEGRFDKCQRIVCGILLAVFTTVILFGAAGMFLVTNQIHNQFSSNKGGLLSSLGDDVGNLGIYMDTSIIKEVEINVLGKVEKARDDVLKKLNSVAKTTKEKLGEQTNVTDILDKAENLAKKVKQVKEDLDVVISESSQLNATGKILSQNLTDLKTNIENDILNCFHPGCNSTRVQIGGLTTKADFSKLDNVQEQLENFQGILSANISDLIEKGKNEFSNIAQSIENETKTRIEVLKVETDKIVNQANKTTSSIVSQVSSIRKSLTAAQNSLKNNVTGKVFSDIGNYWWYSYLGIGSIVCFIVLMYYLGLAAGIMGDPPDVGNTCNRGIGGKILIGAVVTTFLFASLLMLIVTVTFTMFGALLHNEVCLPLTGFINNPLVSREENTVAYISDQLLTRFRPEGFKGKLNISSLLHNCKENKALYSALNLDQMLSGVSLNDLLNLSNFDFDKKIDSLINGTVIDLTDVVILDNATHTQLLNVQNSNLDKINFTSFFLQLESDLTEINLAEFADSLRNASTGIRHQTTIPPSSPDNDTAVADNLLDRANDVEQIENTTISQMEADKKNLKVAIERLRDTVQGTNSPGSKNFSVSTKELLQAFVDAQDRLTVNGSETIKQIIKTIADNILGDVEAVTNSVRKSVTDELGRCEPVYKNFKSAIDAACVTTLYPINAYWFCLGGCLFFLIPNIILALKLVALYSKTDPYQKTEGFENPDYEMYSNTGSKKKKVPTATLR